MYSYSCLLPEEGLWPSLQPLAYTYLPSPLLLPPIQAHNFCSRPPGLSAGEWATPREYHCFYGPSAPLPLAPPYWAFPPALAMAPSPLLPATGYAGPGPPPPAAREGEGEGWAPWPDGDSLQAELRWGRVEERALDPRHPLPDYVRRELRRAYGTYPRADVRVTYRGGEFLLQAAPRVREPEVRVERRVLRRPASGSSDSAREAAGRGRGKKRKGLG